MTKATKTHMILLAGCASLAIGLLGTGDAQANTSRYHHRYHEVRLHHRHHGFGRHYVARPPVSETRRPDYLGTNTLGDAIITGSIGVHRSDFGVMVPDSDGPNMIASGRAKGSGFGADGLPVVIDQN
ncbi:hypothetical protein [Lichenihabitans psoromatis]|uniref:hypothetical protein n=1 Tax=Lichenihabitans psoromatis TaxID=2528642 RepID=UPI001036AB88|nr:hypothetical protein [Lichenihabitans psoromatis]